MCRSFGYLTKLGLGAFALVMASLVVEALSRVFFPQWAPRTGVLTEFWRYDPDYGWAHVPNTRGRFASYGFDTTVTINADGYRGARIPLQRDGAKRRVLVLGDSYVWGFGVEDDEIFTEQMARDCPSLEVINMGVSGYSTDQEVLLYRNKGSAYRPDVVILVVASNDYEANASSKQYVYYYKPRFSLDGNELVLLNHPVPRGFSVERLLAAIAKRSYVFTQLTRLIEGVEDVIGEWRSSSHSAPRPPTHFPRTAGERLTVALVEDLATRVHTDGGRLVVAFTENHGRRGQAMEQALHGSGISFVHLDDFFDPKTAETDHLPGDFHWSADGHRRVARVLALTLARLGEIGDDTCIEPSEAAEVSGQTHRTSAGR